MKTEYERIRFVNRGDHWECISKPDGCHFGKIPILSRLKGFVAWTYEGNIMLSSSILRDIADFMEQLRNDAKDGK